jgi:hypothetical protein
MTIRSMLVGREQAKTTSGLQIHPSPRRTMSTRDRFIGAGNIRQAGRDEPKILAHQKVEARTGPARASRKAAAGSSVYQGGFSGGAARCGARRRVPGVAAALAAAAGSAARRLTGLRGPSGRICLPA